MFIRWRSAPVTSCNLPRSGLTFLRSVQADVQRTSSWSLLAHLPQWCSRLQWAPFCLGVTSALLTAMPGRAAEQIVFPYGQLEFYLPVASLETFARDGKVDKDLAYYFRLLKPAMQAKVRQTLQKTHKQQPWPVSQVLYSPMGESALRNLGDLIQTGPDQNGFYALRSAIIQAAADPQGLSLLGVMNHFPSHNLRINVPLALHLANRVAKYSQLSAEVVQAIQDRSQAAAAAEGPLDLEKLPPLASPGPYPVTKQTLMLQDSRRDRPVPTDLYVPDFQGNLPASIPVVVFSHGLGETRKFSAPFMENLASNGFVVAAPEHIGSDKGQQERLLSGAAREIFQVSEFYNRPLDVSFVLDTLEQKNQSEFGGRLNLKNVGAYGHSFGGYTVLVLAGATVDFQGLRQACQQDDLLKSLNTSLLLQCRALELEASPQAVEWLINGQLRDPRIKSVMAISPVTSPMLGQAGISRIQVPVALFGGGDDPAAPLVLEQLQAFSWLTTPDRYLIVSDAASHTPEITELINRVVLPGMTTDEFNQKMAIFLKNLRGVGLAFMQVYVAGKPEYQPYLQSSYAQTLSDPPFSFNLIRSFPLEQLNQFMRKAGIP